MKEKLKKQKGITLVALVITIIVLLILAVVSISIVMNQGIMTKSKNAVDTHKIAAEKEAIELAYSKYLTEKYNGETNPTLTIADENATVTGNEESGWTITFANGNVYTLSKDGGIEGPTTGGNTGTDIEDDADFDDLCDYLLGEDRKGKFGMDLVILDSNGDMTGFKETEIEGMQLNFISIDNDDNTFFIKFEYKNKIYIVTADRSTFMSKEVKYIGNATELPQKIEEGEKLRIDGIDYTILYVNNDGTVEIVADAVMGKLTLGYEDERAEGNNDFEKAVNSYNNAIERINDYCASLYKDENGNYKNSNIISVRSVGSNRNNPYGDTTQMYTDENISTWNCKYEEESVTVDRVGKVEDNNYEEDYNKMKELGIEACNKHYWLASRSVREGSFDVNFYVRNVYSVVGLGKVYLWYAESIGIANANNDRSSVRPVLKMNASALNSN